MPWLFSEYKTITRVTHITPQLVVAGARHENKEEERSHMGKRSARYTEHSTWLREHSTWFWEHSTWFGEHSTWFRELSTRFRERFQGVVVRYSNS